MNLERKTQRLLSTAAHGRIGIRCFERILPGISRQIRSDAGSRWLNAWGQTRNFDEHERKQIVDPKLLSAIGRLANHPIRQNNTYHAGLTHTYGYLLSQLKTRYGYKRERWTSGIFEQGLGLPRGTLAPAPPTGTLLENTTFLLSRISFSRRDHLVYFPKTNRPASFDSFDFSGLKITRIEEKPHTSKQKNLRLVTDIVDFRRTQSGNSAMLVYSLKQAKKQQLFTCFPINRSFKSDLIEGARLNQSTIVARFNSAVNLAVNGVVGTRSIKQLKLKN